MVVVCYLFYLSTNNDRELEVNKTDYLNNNRKEKIIEFLDNSDIRKEWKFSISMKYLPNFLFPYKSVKPMKSKNLSAPGEMGKK